MSSPIYEFIPEKNLMIEYNIQQKTFNQFRIKFDTNKYLNLVEWYEISMKIDEESQQKVPGSGRFEVGNLDVHYDFLKIEDCPLKLVNTFQKLQFLRVSIQEKEVVKSVKLPIKPTKSEEEEYNPTEAKPDENSPKPSASVLEYVPKEISSNESEKSSKYVPSKKQNDNVELDEYSPMDYNNTNSQPQISYTPSRIKSIVDEDIVENSEEEQENKKSAYRNRNKKDESKKTLSRELFGELSEDEENRVKPEIISIPSSSQTEDDSHSSKRQKLDRTSKHSSRNDFIKYGHESSRDRDKERDSHRKESSKSKDHKRKGKDKKSSSSSSSKLSPSVSKWLTCDKGLTSNSSSNDSTKSKPEKVKKSSSSSLSLHNHKSNKKKPEKSKMTDIEEEKSLSDMMEQYKSLETNMKIYEEEKALRKEKLKDLEILSCEGFSNEKITEYIVRFSTMIKSKILAYRKTGRISQNQDFNPIEITHSNILNENQLLFVMTEIEKLYMAPEDKGMFTDLLTDDIVPELLINMFMVEFNMNRETCLTRLQDQDDRKLLFDVSK